MADDRPPSNNPPDDVVVPYTSEGIPIGPDTNQPEPAAFMDDNSIIYLNPDIHSDMNYPPVYETINVTQTQPNTDFVLIQAFSGNNKISSLTVSTFDPCVTFKSVTVDLDLLNIIRDKMGLGNGQYDIRVCIYRNYIYEVDLNSETNKPGAPGTVQIEEISPSRNEIRVKATLQKYNNSVDEWGKEARFRTNFDYDVIWPAILKDTERDISLISTNWQLIDFDDEAGLDHVIFRLTEPLPSNVKVGNQFQVTRDLISPYTIPVIVNFESQVSSNFNQLRGPNFKAINISDTPSRSTLFESWNSLLGTGTTPKQRIIDKYISGSVDIDLNIDYRKYDNFVHFSSAAERLKNFKYKLELIEQYTSQSNNVSINLVGKSEHEVTSSAEFLQNKALYDSRKDAVIGGFDDYEKYLYYESHSYEDTTYGIYPAATWPKETHSKPYKVMHTTGSEAVSWYTSQLVSASLYDDTNLNILRNTVPLHILQDDNSDSYITFIDMIAQHFDTVYNYISNILLITDRNESVYDGMSKDIIYDAAKSFGWTLQSGFDSSKLWEYVLGTDETGSYNSGTTFVRQESYSHEDIEKQTWKRIVSNIPYLLKTKGTARGLKALLNTYGIPNTILQIQEYGGPAPERVTDSRRSIEKFTYAADFSGSRHIKIDHASIDADKAGTNFSQNTTNRYPSMYEFRIDTTAKQTMHLVSTDETSSITGGGDGSGVGKFEVILEHSSSASTTSSYYNYGRLVFKISSGSSAHESMSTDYAPFYDNDWWNISFGVQDYVSGPSDTGQETFEVRYAKIGEHADAITHTGSKTFTPSSTAAAKFFNGTWGSDQHLLFGGTGSGDSNATYLPFSGSMQEIRGWAEYINDTSFHQHTLAPTSIVGNTIEMGYNDLIWRYSLGTDQRKYNHSTKTVLQTTESIPNINNREPFSTGNTDANFVGWPNSVPYSNKSETYYVNVPNIVGLRPHDNKIRIEANKLSVNQLSWDTSFEVSPFDTNALDSDQVSVALSPQDQIDIDIAMQFGGARLDDYIGDPRDKYSKQYNSLRGLRDLYFKKYDDRYNIWAFIRLLRYINKGFFRQLETMLPARADATVGVIIKPSLLERIKVDTAASLSLEDYMHTASIERKAATISGHTISQSFNNTDFIINTVTINTGTRPGNPSHNRYRDGSEYQYGNYTGSGLQDFINKYGDSSHGTGPFINSISGSFPQYVYSTGLENLIVRGSRLTSLDFNETSPDTIDGGPAVEFILTNPNQLEVVEPRAAQTRARGGSSNAGSRDRSTSEINIR